jgi:hypothetical protein
MATTLAPPRLHFGSIHLLPGQRVQLNWSGEAGASYTVEGASELPNWSTVGGTNSATTNFEFIGAATNRSFFYRVRSP